MEGLKLKDFSESALPIMVENCLNNKNIVIISKRRRTKAIAHLLNERNRRFEIPKDYSGWFAISKQDFEPQVESNNNLKELIESGCKNFMLFKSLTAKYAKLVNDDIIELLEEKILYPGEILKVNKCCKSSVQSNNERSQSLDEELLLCTDRKNRNIAIPLNSYGEFNPIGDKNYLKPNALFQMEFILNHFEFPINIKLAFSHAPASFSPTFNGLLQLIEVQKEDSFVIGYPLQSEKLLVQEIPMKENLRFRIASQSINNSWLSDVTSNLFKYITNIKELKESSTLPTCNLKLFDECVIMFPKVKEEKKMSTSWMFPFYEENKEAEPMLRELKNNYSNRESTVALRNAVKSGIIRPISIREENLIDAYC
ncbi:DgyrCDS4648 [Dimorphilus gyrociliatus]|uniref:DgyrCDS4648 n=1 Tax=Dimorphilus gyrociliatus TaxID=2664684 RepID=A0A7I8VHN6_9ANNE|nr:DgyrCDS4648 [Dimorphilus gyrociliatus]